MGSAGLEALTALVQGRSGWVLGRVKRLGLCECGIGARDTGPSPNRDRRDTAHAALAALLAAPSLRQLRFARSPTRTSDDFIFGIFPRM